MENNNKKMMGNYKKKVYCDVCKSYKPENEVIDGQCKQCFDTQQFGVEEYYEQEYKKDLALREKYGDIDFLYCDVCKSYKPATEVTDRQCKQCFELQQYGTVMYHEQEYKKEVEEILEKEIERKLMEKPKPKRWDTGKRIVALKVTLYPDVKDVDGEIVDFVNEYIDTTNMTRSDLLRRAILHYKAKFEQDKLR